MGKIAIITDSTNYLPQEIIERYNIHVVPLSVNFGLESYREGIDITTEDFYKKLSEVKELPTTSQPAIGDFVKLYEELANEYDEAIAIHISSGISGTMNTSLAASKMVEGINIEVLDSEITSLGLGFMLMEAGEMVNENKSLQEIKDRIVYLIKNMRGYFIVDDLSHLHRGGRLNAAELLVGSMLKIKPVIYFRDKKLEPYEKIRTKKKAINKILKLLEEDVREGIPIKLSVVHAADIKVAEDLLETINKKYLDIEANISEFGPVIGTHTGPGTIGLTWYKVK